MGLLAPLFLLGALAIALPVWLHRLQTQSPERKAFSSTMLLEQSRQQVHLRRKLRYLLLLMLRVALLALLALTFAKPVWERERAITMEPGAILHLLVIDTSFSMQYDNIFGQARDQARRIVNEMADGDAGWIVSASNTVEAKGAMSVDRAGLVAAIDALEPGNGRLDYGVMMAGINALVRDQRRNILIHFISDFQASGLPSRFADLVPVSRNSHHTRLQLYPVGEQTLPNLYVDSIQRVDQRIDVGVRGNQREPTEVTVILNLNGTPAQEQTVTLEAEGQVMLSYAVTGYEEGDNRIEASIRQPDGLGADNRRYAVVDNMPPRPVLLLTNDIQSPAVRYLATALEAGRQGYRADPVRITEFDPRVLQRYPWILIDDLGILDGGLVDSLNTYLQGGGAVLAASGERALARAQLPLLGYAVRQTIVSATHSTPAAVTGIDAGHPMLAGTSGWRDVGVSRYLDLVTDAAAHTLVNLDNGAPLLLERRFGQGRLLLLTSSLDNRWNDLPIRPVFVNFIAEATRYLSGRDLLKREQLAGDYLQLVRSGSAAGQVVAPDGRTILSLADTHRAQQIKLEMPGFYEIYTSDSEQLIAVNPDLRESDMNIMSSGDIRRWNDTAQGGANTTAEAAEGGMIEREPVQIWHILLLLLGIIILAESLLGNRYLGAGRGPV